MINHYEYTTVFWYITVPATDIFPFLAPLKKPIETHIKKPIKTHKGPWGGNNTLVQNVNQSAKNMCSGH